jgi:protein-L-isoaspartate(D-aspartate) O-methyltransferase
VTAELANELAQMGIRDDRVLKVMAEVPRGLFVPEPLRREADADRPLLIGHGQTISQPYVVALMTERLMLLGAERVLEIGTGSGYQTALLAHLATEVYSIEVIPDLSAQAARILLQTLGLTNVRLRVGDGAFGWPDRAPFDRILVTAAPPKVPESLIEQLAPGGRMVVPIGSSDEVQMLKLIERRPDGSHAVHDIIPVRFVPMIDTREGT